MTKTGEKAAFAEEALGFALAQYLRLVRSSNRFAVEPPDLEAALGVHAPAIVAMWHGQHAMIPFARPRSMKHAAALVSRHQDAGAQAVALRRLGVTPIRGSGGRSTRIRDKGGVAALIGMRKQLEQGVTIAITADVPKIARVAGLGIVTLARISGRPIVPIAVVTSRRIDFKSWDRASLGLPFGRGAIVIGEPIRVAAEADAAAMETARLGVQNGLDAVHVRAYGMVGARDPGADLRQA
jgi:hypothetical protein